MLGREDALGLFVAQDLEGGSGQGGGGAQQTSTHAEHEGGGASRATHIVQSYLTSGEFVLPPDGLGKGVRVHTTVSANALIE